MEQEELIREICSLEEKSGCHEVRIKSISVYHFIRREIRTQYLGLNGFNCVERQARGTKKERIISVLISLKHLFQMPTEVPLLFRSFRLDDINGLWMDRFIDPIIEECNLNDYVIFETNNGRNYKNRCHKELVFYDDFFSFLALLFNKLFSFYYKIKFKNEFSKLINSISEFIPSDQIDRKFFYNRIITSLIRVSLYKLLLKRKKVKVVIAASRSSFIPLSCAAKLAGINVFELQHGITYGETLTYSGYRDSLFVPDRFLLFGDVHPKNVYGIDEKYMVNVGWALISYVKRLQLMTNIQDNNILVLSQPQSTDYIVNSMLFLADNNKDINFFLRCHPMEKLDSSQVDRIDKRANVFIQDNKISLVIALTGFNSVIGDKSTAIYEALSYGKKTGILTMNNHKAIFLEEDDASSFWIINDNSSFVSFIKSAKTDKNTLSIYSPFNMKEFVKLIKIHC